MAPERSSFFAIVGLQRRLLLLLVVAMLPVFGLVIASSLSKQRESLVQASENLMTVSRLTALGAERSVEGARQLLNAITSGPSLKGGGLNSLCIEFLANIQSSYRYYSNVGFLDVDGKLICDAMKAEPSAYFGDRSYFNQALATRAFATGDYQIGRITGKASINFGMPVYDNAGSLKGVAFAALELSRLAPDVKASSSFPFSVSVTDRSGTIVGTDRDQMGRIGTRYPDEAFVGAMKALPSSTIIAKDPGGDLKMYAVTAVSDGNRPALFVVASIAREAVTAPLQRRLIFELTALLLLTALGILVARWIGNRTLVLPARRLLKDINLLASDGTAPAVPGHTDEIAELSSAFTRVAGILTQRDTERDQSEAKLHETQALLGMASRVSRLGAWQVDLPSYELTWSDEVRAIHELSSERTPRVEAALEFYAPEYRSAVQQLVANCANHGTPFDAEMQLITARQRRIWVRVAGEALRDAAGNIVRIQGAFQDIDAQKRAEFREYALARRLTTTLENISDAFFLLDQHWNFVFLNEQAVSLLKRSRSALLGQNIWETFPEAGGTMFEHQYRDAVQKNRTSRFEAFFEPLDAWFEVNAYPTEDGLAVYFQDVTVKRRAAEQLRLLESAVARLNDVVVITEASPIHAPGPRIVFVNDAFERLTGYSRAEVLGQSPRLLQGPRTQRAELDRVRASLEQSLPVRAELINYTKAGQEFWIELDIVPIADETKGFTHWVAVERDITERKRVEGEILELNASLEGRVRERTLQLEAANRELEAFSYSVSHDLRAPLNTIDGFGQMLLQSNQQLDDKGRHYLHRIRAGAKQMGELIEGLLSLAKMARDPLRMEQVNLSALTLRVLQECKEAEPQRQVQVRVQDNLWVHGDPAMLHVVIQNLVGNAWKYTSRQPLAVIEVGSETAPDGEKLYFVRDNGAGFDMAFVDKLFMTFQRLHAPSEFSGTGVGLANVKRVIERHGGRVWAEGQPDKGARFYFTLGGQAGDAGSIPA